MAKEIRGGLARAASASPRTAQAPAPQVLQRRAAAPISTPSRPPAFSRGAGGAGSGGGLVTSSRPFAVPTEDDEDKKPNGTLPTGSSSTLRPAGTVPTGSSSSTKPSGTQPGQEQKPGSFWSGVDQGLSDFILARRPEASRDGALPTGGSSNDNRPAGSLPTGGANNALQPGSTGTQDARDNSNRPAGSLPSTTDTTPRTHRQSPEDYQKGFVEKKDVTVRQLTAEEWAALSPEQQQGVVANYAIWQASQQDKAAALVNDGSDGAYSESVRAMFGDQGGSDTYAPNTVRVLQELGFTDQKNDLDNFLNGSSVANYANVLGSAQSTPSVAPTTKVFNNIANSDVFQNEDLQAKLAAGAGMLDAIRSSGTFTPEVLQFTNTPELMLSPEDMSELDVILSNMSNRDVYSRLQSDPETNQILTEDLDAAVARLGESAVTRYFTDQYQNFNGDPSYMSFDEFSQNWLKARG